MQTSLKIISRLCTVGNRLGEVAGEGKPRPYYKPIRGGGHSRGSPRAAMSRWSVPTGLRNHSLPSPPERSLSLSLFLRFGVGPWAGLASKVAATSLSFSIACYSSMFSPLASASSNRRDI